jgi:chemotaxis methyl-accepting protein methylase
MPVGAELREVEVAAVRDIVAQRCGFYLGEPHAGYLGRRIADRIQDLRLDFPSYLQRLRESPVSGGELQALVERLCIYETRFMRDAPDFRALACFVLPQLARELRQTGRRRVRVVSAGCSTGQEAYSLAMILEEAKTELGDAVVEVIGVDLSAEALERGRRGIYTGRELAALDPWRRQRYFQPRGADFEIVPRLRERVRFVQANLARDLPVTQVEVIFCRNVLIYFNAAQRHQVVRSLLAALRLGGYLIVGSADSMWAHRDVLQVMRTSGTIVFRRVKSMPAQEVGPAGPTLAEPAVRVRSVG